MTRAGFAWDAEDYARNSAVQQEWARELIGKLVLEGRESILDIGCGDGKVTAELASRVPRGEAVGVDSAPGMVEKARASFPPESFPNLSFLLMDARALDFPARFTVAFSNAALHWVPDQPAVLRGVVRALVPGGRLLFQMGAKGNAAGMVDAVNRLAGREPWARWLFGMSFPYTFASPDQYAGWLASAGLVPRRIELLPKRMTYRDRGGLEGWVRTTWLPYTEKVPPEMRERFVTELVDLYLSGHPPDVGGGVEVDMVRLEVEAIRP